MFMRCSEGGDANFRCRAQGEGIGDTTAAASLAVRGPADQREPGWVPRDRVRLWGACDRYSIGVCVTRVSWGSQPPFVCIPRGAWEASPSSGQTPTHVSSCELLLLHGLRILPEREGGVKRGKAGGGGLCKAGGLMRRFCHTFGWAGLSQPRFQVDNQR
jgi:hypothetical protein